MNNLTSTLDAKRRPRARPSDVSTSSSDIQPTIYKDPTLRVRVPRAVLEGAHVGPFRKRWLTRLRQRLLPKSAVRVEPLMAPGLSTAVLYASDDLSQDAEFPFAETKLTTGPPDGNLVYQDSPFEIRVAGMLVKNYDWFSSANELVMYSVQTDPDSSGENGKSLPFIHFDHRSDAYSSIERPNTFIPIPASKAYVTGSRGKPSHDHRTDKKDAAKVKSGNCAVHRSDGERRKSVNVQFKIIELDTPNETVKQAIAGIDSLGGILGELSPIAPTFGLLSPAFAVAGVVSKNALDSYAMPDRVISIDMDFLLADRTRVANRTAPNGEYLRYGYYFFLSEPMEAKMYASVLTPKNVRLMLRRCDHDEHAPKTLRGRPVPSRKFFPLTEVNYMVVKVCEPMTNSERKRNHVQLGHAQRLEEIFARSNSGESSENVKQALRTLGRELGLIDSDSEGSKASLQFG